MKNNSEMNSQQEYLFLKDLMNNIPDAIYCKDAKGKLIAANKAYRKILGVQLKNVIGRTDFELFPQAWASKMVEDDHHVFKTGKPLIEKVEPSPQGDDQFLSISRLPRRDDQGKVIGIIGITRDVTKRIYFDHLREERLRMQKKLEVLEELSQMKSEFISTISHELRTPLAIIKQLFLLIYNETAGPTNDQQREILVKARHNIERLKLIIDQLLDMSRIEEKKLSLRYSLVNLGEVLKDSEDFFKGLAAEKNITLHYQLPREAILIFIDAERFIQIINNLIMNAVKFTPESGKIKVEVKVLETKVRIAVVDTGVGIGKSDISRVFEKFVQVSKIDSAQRKGIGLGLSIVKELVERHGGEIWVESVPGKGSQFYFTLPRFYTANVLGKKVKARINQLLETNKKVHLINLLIVNYEEFKKRVDIGQQELFKDLKEIMDSSFVELFPGEKQKIHILDMSHGKYSIIFPDITGKKVSAYCDLLQGKTKSYFGKNKIENVFIAVGVMSYSSKDMVTAGARNLSNLVVKELYIGAEIRRHKRINYKTELELVLSEHEKHTFQTADLSMGGLCFLSHVPLKTDQKVRGVFQLLKKKHLVSIVARIAWMKHVERLPGQPADQYKIGLEFVSLSKKNQNILSQELKLYYE